jgi:hypothetical protein
MLPDGDGFHACERDRRHAWRWTDGHARMEVPAGFVPDEPLELELRVAAGQPAWRAPARQAGIRQARHDRGDAVVAAA